MSRLASTIRTPAADRAIGAIVLDLASPCPEQHRLPHRRKWPCVYRLRMYEIAIKSYHL
jgi:hypothetical protein